MVFQIGDVFFIMSYRVSVTKIPSEKFLSDFNICARWAIGFYCMNSESPACHHIFLLILGVRSLSQIWEALLAQEDTGNCSLHSQLPPSAPLCFLFLSLVYFCPNSVFSASMFTSPSWLGQWLLRWCPFKCIPSLQTAQRIFTFSWLYFLLFWVP